MAKLLHKGLLT